ncbi:dihydroorotase multifunctional complex type [Desulfovibrio sp. X2]|uniref:dihydroorotase n=1 Tax=Desulfovibrio sp. X2 TaxID=941449 RepID=UPI0003589F7C|nr:dihydroorotase [Desulfovibrio sp. X2]EPR43986.1 dihydroorotase multifunctional complex type [Desulfovibrio sp. X2]
MSGANLVIRAARLACGTRNRPADCLVDCLAAEGRILDVLPHDPTRAFEGAEVLDASGKILLPSLVDCHTHLRDPGQEYKEDIPSGLSAAAHGGFGHVMCMANTKPVNDDAAITEAMLDAARKSHPAGPFLHPIGALSKGLSGTELAPMADLAAAGCAAFSNDGMPVASAEFFRRAVEYAATFGRIVIDHCEEPTMAPAAGMNEGAVSARLGLRGQPWVAEASQVARDVLMAECLGLPIHIAHVSCKASVDLIAFAKARGVAVTAETCPHYLLLTEQACEGYDTRAKVNPPLRTLADVESLRQALATGIVDILATDHAPHADHEKEVEFDLAPCGISGLDTALSLVWSLTPGGILTEERLVDAMSHAPGRVFGIETNRFAPGDPADIVVFDPKVRWTASRETMHSKSCNTPWLGSTLVGRVSAHFMGGVRIV